MKNNPPSQPFGHLAATPARRRLAAIALLAVALLLHGGAAFAQRAGVFSEVRFFRPEPRSDVPAEPPASVRIAPAARPPAMDGSLGDPCWQEAEPFSPFVIYRTWDRAAENREVRMAFDQDNLYVGVRLEKARGYELKADTRTDGDAHMWQDDEFELFLDPGPTHSEHYQIIVNASGNFCDLRHSIRWVPDPAAAEPDTLRQIRVTDRDWQSGVEFRLGGGRPEDDHWIIEMRLPAEGMGLPGIPLGARWGLNLASNNPRTGQLTNWIPGDWHNPQTYGHVVFGEPRLGVSGVSLEPPRQGANLFSALFENLEAERRSYRLALFDPDDPVRVQGTAAEFSLGPGRRAVVSASYAVAPGAEQARVVAQARSADGALLFQTQRIADAPAPLRVAVRPYGYLAGSGPVTGEIEVRLGALSLARSRLDAALRRGGQVLATETVPVREAQAAFSLDPAGLPPGLYHLDVELTDETGGTVARESAPFSLAESPFGG